MEINKYFFFLAFLLNAFYANSQCSLEQEVCMSMCSDTWSGPGSDLVCFDPNDTRLTAPVALNYCYSSPDELYFNPIHPVTGEPTIHPETGELWFRKRQASFFVCIPDDICDISFAYYNIVVNPETGEESFSELQGQSESVYLGGNLPTFCMDCPSSRIAYMELYSHRDILNSIGTYRFEMEYTCCDEEGNAIGQSSTTFYYELVDAASDIDVDIFFTASQQIETLNGDTNIDGILPATHAPGPELGPASAGVQVSAVGNGVIDYTVEVYEVDCNNPSDLGVLINSQQIPYEGEEQIFYSFLNIDGWENTYNPNACYRVETIVNTICDTYTEEAYFTITDDCTFCFTVPDEENATIDAAHTAINTYQISSGEIVVETDADKPVSQVLILDEWGRVLDRLMYEGNQPSNQQRRVDVNSAINSRYFLVVTFTKDGLVSKSMLPNVR